MKPLVPVRVERIPDSLAKRTYLVSWRTSSSGSPPVNEMARTPERAACSMTVSAVSTGSVDRSRRTPARIEHCGQLALQRSVIWTTT